MKNESKPCTHKFWDVLPEDRRPCIALMGEFSAGKSTLANLMIGSDPLPMQVVATQLPPVWISHGNGEPAIVDLEGRETPCDLNTLSLLDASEVAFLKIEGEERILEECDIIDMPGISDPNMSDEVWKRLLPVADGVLWCTAATQAWRQSEAAVWETVSEEIRKHSMLLITRSDMLTSQRDRERVLKRVRAETRNLFNEVQIISLTEAREAVDDPEMWRSCGAAEFVDGFLLLLRMIRQTQGGTPTRGSNDISRPHGVSEQMPREELLNSSAEKVLPRRPVRKTNLRQASKLNPNAPESFTPKFS